MLAMYSKHFVHFDLSHTKKFPIANRDAILTFIEYASVISVIGESDKKADISRF